MVRLTSGAMLLNYGNIASALLTAAPSRRDGPAVSNPEDHRLREADARIQHAVPERRNSVATVSQAVVEAV